MSCSFIPNNMKNVISYLEESGMQYLATIGLDGKPKVRPFQFMFEKDNKLWFCTSNQKEVYKELQSISFVELCASLENLSWLRLNAKAVFANNLKVKESILKKSPLVKSIYKTADNPAFEVFYLKDITASISEIGKTPVLFKL